MHRAFLCRSVAAGAALALACAVQDARGADNKTAPTVDQPGSRAAANTAPEKKGSLSDRAVKVLSTYALSILPGKPDPAKYLVPPDAAREVVRAATRSAYAEACNLTDFLQANYITFMRSELARRTWSPEQLWFIDALHTFSTSYFAGSVKIVNNTTGEDESPKKLACPPEQRDKVARVIQNYLSSAKMVSWRVGDSFSGRKESLFSSPDKYLNAEFKNALETGYFEEAKKFATERVEAARQDPSNTVRYAGALGNLAKVYRAEGSPDDAIVIYNQALELFGGARKPQGASSLELRLAFANTLSEMADVYRAQGRLADATDLYKRALPMMFDKGTDDLLRLPTVTATLTNLAKLYIEQGRYYDAISLCERALPQSPSYRSPDADTDVDEAEVRNTLARAFVGQQRYGEAEKQHYLALELYQKALGQNHPYLAGTLKGLADIAELQGHHAEALQLYRRAAKVLSAGTAVGAAIDSADAFRTFSGLASVAYETAQLQPSANQDLMNEAFEASQRATQSSVAAAVAQMAVRFAAGDTTLADLIREEQDLAQLRDVLDKKGLASLSHPPTGSNAELEKRSSAERQELELRLQSVQAKLQKEFPNFTNLTSPKPISIADAQSELRSEEALVTFMRTPSAVFIWALTKERATWQRQNLTDAELSAAVAKLRKSLDISKVQEALQTGSKPADVLFDVETAYSLYDHLLAPVINVIQGKKQLLIIPSGALTSLPFHVLVTASPEGRITDPSEYRDVPWLARRYAVTVLPSVSSLEALRVLAKASQTPKALRGYGDPVFGEASSVKEIKVADATRGYAGYFRGARTDLEALRRGLPALPETATELHAVAQRLGVPDSEIQLGKAATEAAVKRDNLDNFRIVYFATHGLVAGDVKGLAEPALALTLPKVATELDDGLLTASEVAQLKLNADWVVLSACNTAAGDRPEAEALSGLARAFFYSGARALLVSHWPVGSDAATRLTTATFDALKADHSIGRSEALRRAMIAMIEDTSDGWNSYPALWAPFVVVGEGSGGAQ